MIIFISRVMKYFFCVLSLLAASVGFMAEAAPPGSSQDVNVVNQPDVTIAAESVQAYAAFRNVPVHNPDDSRICYFSVPTGKILHIESITGFSRLGNVIAIIVQGSVSEPIELYRVPRTSVSGINYFYDVSPDVGYFTDSNRYDDYISGADFRVSIETDGAGDSDGNNSCAVTGKLFDDLNP